MRVRCVTLNILGLEHDWYESRLPALVRGLRAFRPDVLCLQETAVRLNHPVYNQARAIGDELRLPYSVFAPYGNPIEIISHEHGGIAVLSRWPVLESRSRRLPSGHESSSSNRVAIVAKLESPGGELGVITTHLSWMPGESEVRLLQTGTLLDEITESGHCSRWILMGDLNATSDEPAIIAAGRKLQDAFERVHPWEGGETWSAENSLTRGMGLPNRRIDYIFCDLQAKVRRCEVILDQPIQPERSKGGNAVFCSDHFAVFAELEWEG